MCTVEHGTTECPFSGNSKAEVENPATNIAATTPSKTEAYGEWMVVSKKGRKPPK